MTIHIEKLEIIAIIGILDFERVQPQQVVVDLTLDYHYSENNFISYVEIISIIETMIIDKKYTLLEEALNDIKEKIFENYPQISRLNLKISKPNIIKNANVALSIECLSNNSATKTLKNCIKHTETNTNI
jgi:dihydroneopterin aldolase